MSNATKRGKSSKPHQDDNLHNDLARISSTTQIDGRDVIDMNSYAPFFLASINNALSRGASQLYRDEFGIGIVSWRVISTLAIEPGVTAARICSLVNLDKAATSRALQTLLEQNFLTAVTSKRDPRVRRWWLNDAGYALHDKVLKIALKREIVLLNGVPKQDHDAFLRVMRTMQKNLKNL